MPGVAGYMLSSFDRDTGRLIWSQWFGVKEDRVASKRACREEAVHRLQRYERERPDRMYRLVWHPGSDLPKVSEHDMARPQDIPRYQEQARLIKEGRL